MGALYLLLVESLMILSSEASIREEVAHCRDALAEGNPSKLEIAAQSVAGRSRRVVEVAHSEILNSDEPRFRNRLQNATGRLEAGFQIICSRICASCLHCWDFP